MTEKNYNPGQKQQKSMKKQEKVQKTVIENVKKDKTEEIKEKPQEKEVVTEKIETKTIKKVNEKTKKTKVVVNGVNVPISTKHSSAICYFIKRKKIQDAIKDLEQVAKIKQAVPMIGEVPHRKGNIMSGRFPEKAAKEFIILLKSLSSNATYHGLENPTITQAFANLGERPFGKGGVRKKRTHIVITAENVGGKK
jgi:large subunit ribosomal protein L22